MSGLISGGMSMIGGLFGMRQKAAGPGLAPYIHQMSGAEQQTAAREEAQLLGRQGSLAYEDALLEAARKEYQGNAYRQKQGLQFASSGVMMAGSPMGILFETDFLTKQESAAIRKRGSEMSKLYEMQGLQMLRRGSQAAFSGMVAGMQSEYEAKVQAYNQNQASMQAGLAGIGAGISGIGSALGGFFKP